MAPTKSSLRATGRAAAASLSPEARAAASVEICGAIKALPEWTGARVIALYSALASEPDLASLLDAPGKLFCFPALSGEAMEFHLCEDVSQLRAGAWKILEPDARNCPVVAPNEIELLLIPGLAFTVDGKRLGRGGGHYDRFLERAQPRAVKIGVCFHAQLVAEMPVEIHDREVDRVITERSPR